MSRDQFRERTRAIFRPAPLQPEEDDAPVIDLGGQEFVMRRGDPEFAADEGDDAPIVAPPAPAPRPRFTPMSGGYAPPREQPFRAVPTRQASRILGESRAPAAPIVPPRTMAGPDYDRRPIEDPWNQPESVGRGLAGPMEDPWSQSAATNQSIANRPAAPAAGSTPSNDDDEPVARPTAMPASTEMPVDPGEAAKRAKLRSASAFGASGDEQRRLGEAERGDLRSDRWRRGLAGVGGILGILGAASGSDGLAGLGLATMSGAQSVRPHNERQDAVRGQIAQRLQAVQAERGYQDEQDTRAAAQARQASQDQRQATLDEANLGLTRARTEAIVADSSRAEAEQAMAQRGAAGFRDYIRGRVAAIPAGQTREPLDAVVNADSFNGIEDPEALYRILGSVDAVDRRRGGQGVGGSGGAAHTDTSVDADGNVIQRRVGPSRPRDPNAPAFNGSGGPSAPQAPIAPTDERGARIDVNDPDAVPGWIQRTLNRAGLNDQDTVAGFLLRWQQAPTDTARSAVLSEVGTMAVQAERDDAGGIPAGVNPQEWQRVHTTLTPIAQQRRRAVDLASRVRHWARTRPIALRAAMSAVGEQDRGTVDSVTLAQAEDIHREILRYINPLLRERSGGTVTNNEMARMLGELNAGRSVGVSPAEFAAAIERQVDDYDMALREQSRDFDPRAVDAWAQQHLGGRR